MRTPRQRRWTTAACAAAVLWLSGCGGPATSVPASSELAAGGAPVAADDPGAASRAAALARYADGDGDTPMTAITPDVVGLAPTAAAAQLAADGLDLRLVAYDRAQPITVQWPPAGQPVPLDRTVEGWLGQPPEPVTSPAEPADPSPAATATGPPGTEATATPAATAAPTADATPPAPAQVASRYVLPPHTEGRLRTNPRRLPALPLGTELTGRASWYGPGFQGLTTACGHVYDMNGPTIAARELRCGTVVRITGPSGRTVEATVTDWGPAEWTGRRFDLSAAVFNAIAPLGTGVIDVRVVTANVPG